MTKRFRDEVVELHRFLEQWLKGEVPAGDGRPRRLDDALAEDFVVVHPSGSRGDKAGALRAFASAHGEKGPGYALVISNVDVRMLSADVALATYEEDHAGEDGRARLSTAVLRQRRNGSGIEWLFLHETLISDA